MFCPPPQSQIRSYGLEYCFFFVLMMAKDYFSLKAVCSKMSDFTDSTTRENTGSGMAIICMASLIVISSNINQVKGWLYVAFQRNCSNGHIRSFNDYDVSDCELTSLFNCRKI